MAQTTSDPPWLYLPAEVSQQIRPVVGEIVEAIIKGIPLDVPVYAMPMEGRFGQGVRRGVQIALNRFLDLPGTRLPALSDDGKWVYEGLGRGEVRSGRSLESLLAAYRYGARVTFRAISRTVDVSQMAPDVLLALGESLFAYIDELSAASAQGYAHEQSERAGEQQRLRGELVEKLLRGDSSAGAVTRAAAATGPPSAPRSSVRSRVAGPSSARPGRGRRRRSRCSWRRRRPVAGSQRRSSRGRVPRPCGSRSTWPSSSCGPSRWPPTTWPTSC